MPKISDPALLARLNSNARPGFIPGTGPAAPSGYQRTPEGLAPISGGPQDPGIAARLAAAEASARAAASTPIETAAQMQLIGARQAAEMATTRQRLQLEADAKERDRQMRPPLTAKERVDALAGYKSAQQLDRAISDIEARFAEGPGATSGLAGLQDYNPLSTANQRFDSAGNRTRGFVKQALGFTGGENNTARESEYNLGPYIPQASDRDETARDKIEALKQLRDQARERSIAVLGGVPDESGRITPLADILPPPNGSASPNTPLPRSGGIQRAAPIYGDGGGRLIAPVGDGYRIEANPALAGVNARVNAMLQRGASDADVRDYVASIGAPGVAEATLAFRRKNPAYRGGYTIDLENQRVPMSAGQQAINAIGNSPVGAYFTNAADALTLGTLDNMTDNPAMTRAIQEGVRKQHPVASVLGGISGAALGAGATELGLGAASARAGSGLLSRLLASPVAADAAYGAGYGAGSADDGSRLLGAGAGAVGSVAGGMFGRSATRSAGSALKGVRNGAVDYLRRAGIPLTVGQTLGQSGTVGNIVRGLEDRVAGLPFVGDMVRARRLEGTTAFNRAAFREGLEAVGGNVGDNIAERGVDAARAVRSQAYRDALDPVTLTPDPVFNTDYAASVAAGRRLPTAAREQTDFGLRTAGEQVDPVTGQLDGNGFQQAIRGLRRTASSNATEVNGADIGAVLRQGEDAFTGLLDRQAPGASQAFADANAVNRNTEILRDAVNRARNGSRSGETGVFTPSQLADAAAANARRFGNAQGTTNQPFFDLTRAGQAVLPSTVPDSGTAGRLAALALPGALASGGAGAGYAAGDTDGGAKTGLALGALLALGGTRGGQRALTSLLADRPDALVRLGQSVGRRSRYGGMFGAGLSAPAVATLLSQ